MSAQVQRHWRDDIEGLVAELKAKQSAKWAADRAAAPQRPPVVLAPLVISSAADVISRVRSHTSGSANLATQDEAYQVAEEIMRRWPPMPYGTSVSVRPNRDAFSLQWVVYGSN